MEINFKILYLLHTISLILFYNYNLLHNKVKNYNLRVAISQYEKLSNFRPKRILLESLYYLPRYQDVFIVTTHYINTYFILFLLSFKLILNIYRELEFIICRSCYVVG